MPHPQDTLFSTLNFTKHVSTTGVTSYHTLPPSPDPILVLLHGYPNTAYLWRHVIPLLPPGPIFVPDLPGYGMSRAASAHDKVSIGRAVLDALGEVLGPTSEARRVVLVGHDRGARVAHHLHLAALEEAIPGFEIVGLGLLDIVPTVSQWGIGGVAAQATGWFHWSFLANAEMAVRMIGAYGGGRWCGDMIARWCGTNERGLERMRDGGAEAVYAGFFDKREVIEATTRDYEAGATVDVEFESKAIADGRRIQVPLLLVYSAGFLPKRATKPILEVWSQPWSEGPHLITECPIGGGVGHFVPEEAPEETADALRRWLETL